MIHVSYVGMCDAINRNNSAPEENIAPLQLLKHHWKIINPTQRTKQAVVIQALGLMNVVQFMM